jgi:methylenetetrahydrofolate reductase (NADPH)
LRCGVGASLRSLRDHIGRFGRLLMDDGPDDVLRGLLTSPSIAKTTIAGLHFFPFGGLRKTSQWLHDFDSREWFRPVGHTVSSV